MRAGRGSTTSASPHGTSRRITSSSDPDRHCASGRVAFAVKTHKTVRAGHRRGGRTPSPRTRPRPAPRGPPGRPRRAGTPCGPASRSAGVPRWSGPAAHRAQLAAHQRPGRLHLVGRVDLVERLPGDLVVDPLAAQPWASARRASPRPACRDCTQERANAWSSTRPTSSNRSSSRSATSPGTRRWPAGLQLGAAAGLAGELVEEDLAGHLLGVRVRAEGGGVLGRVGHGGGQLREMKNRPSGPLGGRDQTGGDPWVQSRESEVNVGRLRGLFVNLRSHPQLLEDSLLQPLARSGLSRRKLRAFSLPCPS